MSFMDQDNLSLIKHREINFCQLRPDNQAFDASLVLSDIEGMHSVHPATSYQLLVSYDVRHITMQAIEELLTELNFHLSSKLMFKLKRALYYYTEETQRINLGLDSDCKDCTQMYINRFQRLQRGCRDERPEHWRTYL